MPEEHNPKTRDVDSLLAEFTDRVLSGQAAEASDMGIEDDEMLNLQEMAVRLHREFGLKSPDPAMARRIKARLAAEWQRSGPAAQRETIWSRGWRSLSSMFSGGQRRVYVFALAAAAVIVLVVVAVPLSAGIQLPGTAVGGGNLFPLILLAGFALVVVLWLFSRRK